MGDSPRSKIIVGNWKMNKTKAEARAYVETLASLFQKSQVLVYLAVSFTSIAATVEAAKGKPLTIGAQNMHDAEAGAFTGEVSAPMLLEVGAQFVLLGHSERRRYFKESNAFINKKMRRAIDSGIQPILCIGESEDERASGATEKVLEEQLADCLHGISAKEAASVVVAYEPVWAIGTGRVASPENAEEAHEYCRRKLGLLWGLSVAEKVPILYGGSVVPENAKNLKLQPDVDGLLVGGASLSPHTFSKIIMA